MNEEQKIHYRETFLEGVRQNAHKDLQELMRTVVRTHIDEPTGTQDVYKLFSGIFDDVFLDMYNKKIDLKRKTRHMLEMLSLPHHYKPYDERMKLYKDIIENRTYYQHKKKKWQESGPDPVENSDEETKNS